jgi:hypothetical protein
MTEKFKGEVPPQEHEQGEKVTIDFKEVADSILDEGRMSIEKSGTDKYPSEAREMLEAVTEENVKKAILKQADFSEAMTWYVDGLNEKGRPTSMSGGKTDRSLGVTRAVYLTIQEDQSKNIKVCANVDLLHMDDQKPEIKVYLYASKIDLDFPRWEYKDGGDGQCTICQGWGCWECGFSGGY